MLLLTLAIVDDIGAIAVIAVFYTDDLRAGMLLVAAVLAVVVWAMYRVNVTLTGAVRRRRVRALAGGLRVGCARHDRRRRARVC